MDNGVELSITTSSVSVPFAMVLATLVANARTSNAIIVAIKDIWPAIANNQFMTRRQMMIWSHNPPMNILKKTTPEAADPSEPHSAQAAKDHPADQPSPDVSMDAQHEDVPPDSFLRSGTKRHFPSDSDSDTTPKPQRRSQIKPSPNLNVPRNSPKAPKDPKAPKESPSGND